MGDSAFPLLGWNLLTFLLSVINSTISLRCLPPRDYEFLVLLINCITPQSPSNSAFSSCKLFRLSQVIGPCRYPVISLLNGHSHWLSNDSTHNALLSRQCVWSGKVWFSTPFGASVSFPQCHKSRLAEPIQMTLPFLPALNFSFAHSLKVSTSAGKTVL